MEQVKNNTLYIGGVSTKKLAEQYGTPLYIYDQDSIEKRIEAFKTNFRSEQFATQIVYASKAFLCKAMAALVEKHKLGMDVVSSGELYIASQSGFDMKNIVFHGNNKSREELQMAIDQRIGTIVLDNIAEARELAKFKMKEDMDVLLRINPGVEAHTHQYIVTAHIDSKFGVLKTEIKTIKEIVQIIESNPNLHFKGFHAHIGSQIFDRNAFKAEIETMGQFVSEMKQEMKRDFPTLDLGGGFAALYTNEDKPIPINEVCAVIIEQCESINTQFQLNLKKILIEPGRSIVAEAGYSLYTIGFTKDTPHKKYIFVDGGMSDNIRPALYQAKYRADIANKMNDQKDQEVCIAGKCCESGDLLIEKITLPKAQQDDLLVMYTTGAYGYSMASTYNALRIPAVVFVKNGKDSLVVHRQTYEELISKDEGEIL